MFPYQIIYAERETHRAQFANGKCVAKAKHTQDPWKEAIDGDKSPATQEEVDAWQAYQDLSVELSAAKQRIAELEAEAKKPLPAKK